MSDVLNSISSYGRKIWDYATTPAPKPSAKAVASVASPLLAAGACMPEASDTDPVADKVFAEPDAGATFTPDGGQVVEIEPFIQFNGELFGEQDELVFEATIITANGLQDKDLSLQIYSDPTLISTDLTCHPGAKDTLGDPTSPASWARVYIKQVTIEKTLDEYAIQGIDIPENQDLWTDPNIPLGAYCGDDKTRAQVVDNPADPNQPQVFERPLNHELYNSPDGTRLTVKAVLAINRNDMVFDPSQAHQYEIRLVGRIKVE